MALSPLNLNLIYQVLSLSAFLMLFVPLCLRSRDPSSNIGLSFYMFWLSLACLNHFISSIIWRDNALDSAPLWCEISSRIVIAVNLAIPASSLCIQRGLYRLTLSPSTQLDAVKRRRDLITDTVIGLGLPLCAVGLYSIVQGHRYDIFEQIGCYPAIHNVTLAFPILHVPPILIGLVSASYGVASFRELWQRLWSLDFQSDKHLELRRMYMRLLALSSGDIVFTVPLMTAMLVFNALNDVKPWISWAVTHSDFDRVDQYPLAVRLDAAPTTMAFVFAVEWTRWAAVFCAFVFVAIFAGSAEVRAKGASSARAVKILVGAIKSHFGKRMSISAVSIRSTSSNRSDAAFV